jgi:hypothetical protein
VEKIGRGLQSGCQLFVCSYPLSLAASVSLSTMRVLALVVFIYLFSSVLSGTLIYYILVVSNILTAETDSSDDAPPPSPTVTFSATIFDQAPAYMTHSHYPSDYWSYGGWTDNPVCLLLLFIFKILYINTNIDVIDLWSIWHSKRVVWMVDLRFRTAHVDVCNSATGEWEWSGHQW